VLSTLGADDPFLLVLPALITTSGGVAMAMAFMMFGKKRRDGRPTDSDEALAAAAATGYAGLTSETLGSPDPLGSSGPTAAALPVDPEMALPRWRRPSLLEARRADPVRMAAQAPMTMTFDRGAAAEVEGGERRRIRFRVVPLLDRPDELEAIELGMLDEGDEVQLLDRSAAFWHVLCPDGRQGWVHKMVLGEAIDTGDILGPGTRATAIRDADHYADTGVDRPLAASAFSFGAGEPGDADPTGPPSWSLPGSTATETSYELDEDVLAAYRAARSRA
jgi:hypothetical protein